jgi:hypothetical protein
MEIVQRRNRQKKDNTKVADELRSWVQIIPSSPFFYSGKVTFAPP